MLKFLNRMVDLIHRNHDKVGFELVSAKTNPNQ